MVMVVRETKTHAIKHKILKTNGICFIFGDQKVQEYHILMTK